MAFKKAEDFQITHMVMFNGNGPLIMSPILDGDTTKKAKAEESIFKVLKPSAVVDFNVFPIMYVEKYKENEKPLVLNKSLDRNTILSPRFCAGWNWIALSKKSEGIGPYLRDSEMLDNEILLYPYEQKNGVVWNMSRVLFLDLRFISTNVSVFAFDAFEGKIKRIGTLSLRKAFSRDNGWTVHPMYKKYQISEINAVAQTMRGVMEPVMVRGQTEKDRDARLQFMTMDSEMGHIISSAEEVVFGKRVSALGNVAREGWEHGHPSDDTISELVEMITDKKKSGKFNLDKAKLFNVKHDLRHVSNCLLCMRTVIEAFHPLFFELIQDGSNDVNEQELLRQLAKEKFAVESEMSEADVAD